MQQANRKEENTLHTINHGSSKFSESSEAMPAFVFPIRTTLGVRPIADCPVWSGGPVPKGRLSRNGRGLELPSGAQDGKDIHK